MPAVHPQTVGVSARVSARVSAAAERTHLDGQADRVGAVCAAKGWQVAKVVTEGGRGVNDQHPHVRALLTDPSIGKLVVEHQDRCSRFGVASLLTLLKTQGRDLVIVNEADTGHEDLMLDLVAIITSFTVRLYGRRRASRKKTQVLAALEGN